MAWRALSPEETLPRTRSVQTVKSDQRNLEEPGSRCLSPDCRTSASDSSFLASLRWSDVKSTERRGPLILEALIIRRAAAGNFPSARAWSAKPGKEERRAHLRSQRNFSAARAWRVRRSQRRGGRRI